MPNEHHTSEQPEGDPAGILGPTIQVPSSSVAIVQPAYIRPPGPFAARPFGAAVLFVAIYLAAFVITSLLASPESMAATQWTALISVIVASLVMIGFFERRQWDLGLARPLPVVAREILLGFAVASGLILIANGLILLTTSASHAVGNGLDGLELLTLFAPAVLHEELLFRGYPFQKLARWNATVAVLAAASLFAFLHSGNHAVGFVALTNIFIAGVLLSLAYLLRMNLWFPIALHFAWNVLTGPFLGHEVSGFVLSSSLLILRDPGPAVLTGGEFGIEASVWMTLAEGALTLVLLDRLRKAKALSSVSNGEVAF